MTELRTTEQGEGRGERGYHFIQNLSVMLSCTLHAYVHGGVYYVPEYVSARRRNGTANQY